MNIDLIPRDAVLFVIATIAGMIIGAIHATLGTSASPIWPIKLYLALFRVGQPKLLRRYAEGRSRFSRREQFIAAAFIWFFFPSVDWDFSLDACATAIAKK